MRKNFKTILKLFALGTIFVLGGCSKETFDEGIYQNQITVKKVSLKNLPQNQNAKLFEAVNKIRNFNETLATSRVIYDSIKGVFYDDEKGIYIEKENGYKSYTFPIIKNGGDEKIENILFTLKQDGEYETMKVKYDFTKEELDVMTKEQLEQHQPEYTSLEAGKFGVPVLICWALLTYVDGDSFESGVGGWISEEHCEWGGSGGGGSGDNPGGSSWGGPSGYNPSSGGGSGGISTTPIAIKKTPCQQLQQINSEPILNVSTPKTVLDNLNDIASNMTSNPRERGYILIPPSTAVAGFLEQYGDGPLNGDGMDFGTSIGNNAITAMIHCHYKNTQLSIFSLADLQTIYSGLDEGYIYNIETFTSYLVTAHGTRYALKFSPEPITSAITTAPTTFSGSDMLFAGWEYDNVRDSKEKKYEKKVKPNKSISENEKGFLEFLKEKGLKLDLYRADSTFSNWEKLSIDTSGNVVGKPCP